MTSAFSYTLDILGKKKIQLLNCGKPRFKKILETDISAIEAREHPFRAVEYLSVGTEYIHCKC